ncbi:DUF6114 domain-containing protein [Bacillus marinisedimentorum]|uniref:DUF6114 domain-containing protein n=1 Tax=Bacillus marinisedimentorum TaxID=1821260 RepID=UPI0007E1E284|nr:DUF6114 domain-containing protein [Bacillus marinisedimentorum]
MATKQQKKPSAFKNWRSKRPFLGATLSLLAGLLILWIPFNLSKIAFLPGSMAFVGFLFGGLIVLTAVMAYIFPQFSTILGVFVIFFSVLSVMGALGGMFIGTILGITGGSFCIGWQQVNTNANQSDKQPLSQKGSSKLTAGKISAG